MVPGIAPVWAACVAKCRAQIWCSRPPLGKRNRNEEAKKSNFFFERPLCQICARSRAGDRGRTSAAPPVSAMGLLTIIKKVKAKEKEVRVLMVGLDNAGKTTIVKRVNGEDISTISPTLGFNIKTMSFRGYRMNIWDVGGQKTLRSYWRNYYEATDGMVWVVDSADVRRLRDCKDELHKLLGEEKLAGSSLLIFANKQDIPGALTKKEIAQVLELDQMEKRHWHIEGCSAVTGEGLLEGFKWCVKDIGARIYMHD